MLECWQNIQTCRHKYVVIAVREEPARRQNSRAADGQTNATEMEMQTKSNWKAGPPASLRSHPNSLHFSSCERRGHSRRHFSPTLGLESDSDEIGTEFFFAPGQDEHLVPGTEGKLDFRVNSLHVYNSVG